MAAPKLRLVFYENGNGLQSYYYLERSEGLRVIEILKILTKIGNWTPVSELADRININSMVLRWTILKLPGAKYIDIELNDKGKISAANINLNLNAERTVYIETDGCQINTHDGWKECKTFMLFELDKVSEEKLSRTTTAEFIPLTIIKAVVSASIFERA